MNTERHTEYTKADAVAFGRAWDLHWTTNDFHFLYSHGGSVYPTSLKQKVVADLKKNMPDYGIEQYFTTQAHIFEQADHMAMAVDRKTEEFVSMYAGRWFEHRDIKFLYIWTAMIGNAYRGSRLYAYTRSVFYNGLGRSSFPFPQLLAMKTYNPRIYNAIWSTYGRSEGVAVYPNLYDIAHPHPRLRALAGELAALICPNEPYVEELSILRGAQAAVAPDYHPYMQKSDDAVVWDFFSRNLTRADQILCLVDVPENAREALLEKNGWNIADRVTG